LGWRIRLSPDSNDVDAVTGKTPQEQHPLIMGLAGLFFLLGAQGGLVSTVALGREILKSPHALTAVAGLSCLGVQIISSRFMGNQSIRNFHAYLGSATMALLVVHAYLGLTLNFS